MALGTKFLTGRVTFTGGADRVIPQATLDALSGSILAVQVKALNGNAAVCEVGNIGGGSGFTAGTGYELGAGQGVGLDYADPADWYVRGTAGQGLCWVISIEG